MKERNVIVALVAPCYNRGCQLSVCEERSHSGRVRPSRKRVGDEPREFESRPLRQRKSPTIITVVGDFACVFSLMPIELLTRRPCVTQKNLLTVAPFRFWRGSQHSAAQDPINSSMGINLLVI